MLSSISLENFKSFNKLDDLKLKPITILCGKNSCGKSSILQSILLLKQTKESKNNVSSALLNGKYVHLGAFDNIIYGFDSKSEVTLCYEFQFTRAKFLGSPTGSARIPSYFLMRFLVGKSAAEDKLATHSIKISISMKSSEDSLQGNKKTYVTRYNVNITSKNENADVIYNSEIKLERNAKDYTISWSGIYPKNDDDKEFLSGKRESVRVSFANFTPLIHMFIQKKQEDKEEAIPDYLINHFGALNDFLTNETDECSYIGPLREEPSRRYFYDNEVIDIGIKGENAAYIYQTEQDNMLNDHFFPGDEPDSKSKAITLKDALRIWLEWMGIYDFQPDVQGEMIRLKMGSNSCPKAIVNIADVGFGVSQIFPIILEGLRINKYATLLLEQPEIHLHPGMQMRMADFFIALAKSEKNVIIETHSDHMINRIVRRILEDATGKIGESIGIYFVSGSDEGSKIEEIKIDRNYGITNWPEGFFDQAASEQEKILLAGLKNRKSNSVRS